MKHVRTHPMIMSHRHYTRACSASGRVQHVRQWTIHDGVRVRLLWGRLWHGVLLVNSRLFLISICPIFYLINFMYIVVVKDNTHI